jgi:hypothetical protein
MYEIILFSGGVYKFDELKETVEDLGGLVLRKDHLQISRGESYLAEEIQVMIIIPEHDADLIEVISQDIKGTVDKLNLKKSERNIVLTYLSIYNVLSQTDSWITIEEIKDLIECPCPAQLCQNTEKCALEELKSSIDKLCQQEIVKSRKTNKQIEYRLKNRETNE